MYNDNLARKYDFPESREYKNVSTPRQLAKPKSKTKIKFGATLKLGVVIAFFIVGAITVLSRNVAVTEQSDKVNELKNEYSMLETENRQKEIEISRKVDLATVEEAAISVCNMNRARQEQIVYVNVESQDYGVVNEVPENEKKGFLWGLLAYFK